AAAALEPGDVRDRARGEGQARSTAEHAAAVGADRRLTTPPSEEAGELTASGWAPRRGRPAPARAPDARHPATCFPGRSPSAPRARETRSPPPGPCALRRYAR